MIHARADYDAIQPWPTKRAHYARSPFYAEGTKQFRADLDENEMHGLQPIIPDDEPVFLIRGQDLAAIPTMDAWCAHAEMIGADPTIIAAVHRHMELVREWQQTHAKVPDAPADVLR